MKIGVFGGTFNPVHWGHLVLAEAVRDQEALSEVLFVPTALPPHKPLGAMLEIQHRLEMTRLAIQGVAGFEISEIEAVPGRVSYSIDTLDQLRQAYPEGASLRFIVGADQLDEIETWKDYERLLDEYGLYVAQRVESGRDESWRRWGHCLQVVHMPLIDVSSTEIRNQVAQGRSIRFLVPPAVEQYIQQTGLYRP